jgi:hypothetical protein
MSCIRLRGDRVRDEEASRADRPTPDAARPDDAVAFGDVSPSASPARGSVSEARPGVRDSARTLAQTAATDEGN